MAVFDVLVWKITESYAYSGYDAGYFIHVQFNDATEAFSVLVNDQPNEQVSGTAFTNGPHFYDSPGEVTLLTSTPYYHYCDGVDLKRVTFNYVFPYAGLVTDPNALECQIAPTCDLEISSSYIVTPTSAPSATDGEITITGTSSNGTIKYSLNPDFNYTTQGQVSGTFSNLGIGEYIIYAKDPVGCQDSINIEVAVTREYGIRWVLEYDDFINQNTTKIEILERAYEGSPTEVTGGDDPFILIYQGDVNDMYKPVIPSNAEITLKAMFEGQFDDIFSDDDRKYLIKYYRDYGSGFELRWTGFVLPEFVDQSYLAPPCDITFTASDGLGDLKTYAFLDPYLNIYRGELSQMKVVSEILQKTGLTIPIRCAVNVFDVGMDTSVSDDPLDQAYQDVRIYYEDKVSAQTKISNNVTSIISVTPEMCDVVLEEQPRPYGARLYQAGGYWWIVRNQDAVREYAYRQYDYLGAYESNGTYNPLINLERPITADRLAFRDGSQRLIFDRNYGFFQIVHDLKNDNNLIDEGRFEKRDLIQLSSGNLFFKNWNINVAQAGLRYGLETVKNGNSLGAFFADFATVSAAQVDNSVYSVEIPFVSGISDVLRFNFDYLGVPKFNVPWIRIAWEIKMTLASSTVYITDGAFHASNEPEKAKNELYISNFNSWQHYELVFGGPQTTLFDSAEGTIKITFYFHNHKGRDYTSFADLKTFDTNVTNSQTLIGTRKMVGIAGVPDGKTYFYELEKSDDAESSPDVLRPNDFDSFFPLVWRLKETSALDPGLPLTSKILIDNVSLGYLPRVDTGDGFDNIELPETVEYEELVNNFVKPNLITPVLLGDMPAINNAKNLFRSWLRLSDGTPTSSWSRSGKTEDKFLLELLLEDQITQLSQPKRKLSFSGISDIHIDFITAIKDYLDDRRYIITNYKLSDKNCTYTLDIAEVLTSEDGEAPVITGEFSSAFSSAFRR